MALNEESRPTSTRFSAVATAAVAARRRGARGTVHGASTTAAVASTAAARTA